MGAEAVVPQLGTLGGVGSIVQAGSSLIGTILQGYGLYKQIQDTKAQRSLMKKWRTEDIARDNQKYQTDLEASRDQLLWNKNESKRNWKWAEEERGYNRTTDMVNRMSGLLSQQPVLEDRLMNIWRR